MSARLVFTVGAALAACSGPSREPASPPQPQPRVRVIATAELAAIPEAAPADRLELTFTGDIMFGGWFHDVFRAVATDTADPLADVDALLASDLAIANLETPVVEALPEGVTGHLRFAAFPDELALLPHHHIWAVTVANNHANDLGVDGVRETAAHLDALGIAAAGAPRDGLPAIRVETVIAKGWRIGLIAATVKLNHKLGGYDHVAWVQGMRLADEVAPVVRAARGDHDLVFVQVHWGDELADEPARWQIDAAHALIDAGADAVIGSHPHVLQKIERYEGGVIAYSLGNFVFRNVELPQRLTGVLRLAYARGPRCLERAIFHPAVMKGGDIAHPVPAEGRWFDDVAARLTSLSRPTRWEPSEDRLEAEGSCGGSARRVASAQ